MPTADRIRELAQQPFQLAHAPGQGYRAAYVTPASVEAIIRTALAEQREEDARVCDAYAGECRITAKTQEPQTALRMDDMASAAEQCAAAIRGNASAESEGTR